MINSSTTKLWLLVLIIGISSILTAIPQNELYEFGIGFPMKATPNAQVIVGSPAQGTAALSWTELGGLNVLGDGTAYDVSVNHRVAGDRFNGTYYVAGYWDLDNNNEWVEIGNFPGAQPCDQFFSTAYAISQDGSTLAGMGWNANWHVDAFKWTAATGFTNLCPGSPTNSRVNCLSGDGTIAGGWKETDFGPRQPVIWDANNEMTIIGGPESMGEVIGISTDAHYKVGCYGNYGFSYHDNELETFGYDDFTTVACWSNTSGLTVGVSRNFWEMIQMGFVYSTDLGYHDATEYFTSMGVAGMEGVTILNVGWVSDDGKTFTGGCMTATELTGFIIKLSDGGNIAGTITLTGGNGNITDVSVVTGSFVAHPQANGTYNLNLPQGTYSVTASLPGYVSQTQNDIQVVEGQTVSNTNFNLAAIQNAGFIQGNVTITGGIGNITTATVSAGTYTTHPDLNGFYQLIVPAGTYEVVAEMENYITQNIPNIQVTANQTYTLNIELLNVNTPAFFNLHVNVDEPTDLTKAKIIVDGILNFLNAEGDCSGQIVFGEKRLNVFIPGYKALNAQTVNFAPMDTTDIVINMEKIWYDPQNVNAQSNGLISWEKPLPPTAWRDNFDTWANQSSIALGNPGWHPWNFVIEGENDAFITDQEAYSGEKSLHVTSSTDVIVDIADYISATYYTSGVYNVNFKIKVTEGNCAHYNIIRTLYGEAGIEFGVELFFRENGTINIMTAGTENNTLTYNHGEWIDIKQEINLDQDQGRLWINGTLAETWQWSLDSFSGVQGENALTFVDFSGEPKPGSDETGDFFLDDFCFYAPAADLVTGYNLYLDNLNAPYMSNLTALEYTLSNVPSGTHTYAVSALYPNHESDLLTHSFSLIGTNDPSQAYTLSLGSYPNPFNPSTTISYSLPRQGNVEINIYNVKGQRVKNLVHETKSPGNYRVVWNGTDSSNKKVTSGIYFLQFKSPDKVLNHKIMLLK